MSARGTAAPAAVLATVLAALVALGGPAARAAAPAYRVTAKPPTVHAKAYLVAEAGGSGRILVQRDPHRHLAPASTIKLLTAFTSELHVDWEKPPTYRVSRAAARTEGTSADFRTGERYTHEALLHVLLVRSANDAAETVARSFPGATVTWPSGDTVRYPHGRKAFLTLANRTARAMGLEETRMATPSGLDAAGGYTTAHDLATLGTNAPDLEWVSEATSSARYTVRTSSGKRPRTFDSTVNVIGTAPVLWGKNGDTTKAGKTCVLIVQRDKRPYVVAVLGARNEDEMYREALRLLRWAADRGPVTNLGRLPALFPLGSFE